MAAKLTNEERQQIVEHLMAGKSQGWTARQVGRHVSTVNRIAKAEGIESNVADTKKATEANRAYAEGRRLELIGKGFDKAQDLLATIADASELQKWSVALGTLVDKARLETGEATSRGESTHKHKNYDMSQIADEELEEFERILRGDT